LAKNGPPGLQLGEGTQNGFFDEMFGAGAEVSPHYHKLRDAFAGITPEDFTAKRNSVDLAFLWQGVTFNVYGDSRGQERVFPFDLVPRIIPAKEWEFMVFRQENPNSMISSICQAREKPAWCATRSPSRCRRS